MIFAVKRPNEWMLLTPFIHDRMPEDGSQSDFCVIVTAGKGCLELNEHRPLGFLDLKSTRMYIVFSYSQIHGFCID